MYCLVVTDDYSRFTWVFFLATKDETIGILKSLITGIENLCMTQARTPKQNGVAERRNRILIEAARTMLADSKLPTTFWAEVVNTACYVQNRALDSKSSHNDGVQTSKLMKERRLMRIQGKTVNVIGSTINVVGKNEVNVIGGKTSIELHLIQICPALKKMIAIFDFFKR
ncbi:putative ribonuclease H-like domain-containing protein [Tanacetum coccineum]